MLQLENDTPFGAAIALFPNRDAIDTLYVVTRGTFALSPRFEPITPRVQPQLTDVYFGEPETSSLKYTSELHIGKPGCDVVLIGQAWAPEGRPAAEQYVAVSLAGRRKMVRVIGDRVWQRGGRPSRPEPFQSMPLVYERAFGGMHKVSDNAPVLVEDRNPVGVGFAGKRSADEMVGQKLPNLEDPTKPLERVGDRPPPSCFGFVAASWQPRRAFAGTYDQAWKEQRAPYLPRDFDPRFFHAAAPELTFERGLQGGELVEVQGASRAGGLRFELPRAWPRISVRVAGSTETPPLRLETVMIEPEQNRVSLTWRSEVPCDKRALKVERVTIQPGT